MNDKLFECMRLTLANLFVLYFKTHSFHWNVTGVQFSQMHDFFGKLYEELHGAVDPLAEQIRINGAFAPRTLAELYKPSTINETALAGNNATAMLAELARDNDEVVRNYTECISIAKSLNNEGLVDYLGGRIDAHKKIGWMIKSHLE
jgi:starvation-inducible DNA-binding protein